MQKQLNDQMKLDFIKDNLKGQLTLGELAGKYGRTVNEIRKLKQEDWFVDATIFYKEIIKAFIDNIVSVDFDQDNLHDLLYKLGVDKDK